ncbi:MAG: hypothetical protein QOE70_1951 [Chthoniobacter sp.]|nr:hypothetical protein [Chthoniobacter sp.]
MARVLIVHFASTWMLVGLIWVIQIVAYPQFLRVSEAAFANYHFAHCLRIGLMATPLLAVEAVTAAGLLYQGHRELPFLISVGLIPAIWLSTAVLQAPMHTKLMKGADAGIVRRLIRTNWLRTLAWTTRGLLIGCVVAA